MPRGVRVGDDALSNVVRLFVLCGQTGAKLNILFDILHMQAIELIKFCAESMKAMSKVGIRMDDCRYLTLWREYRDLMEQHHKKTYAVALLSARHNISERTLARILKRLSSEV